MFPLNQPQETFQLLYTRLQISLCTKHLKTFKTINRIAESILILSIDRTSNYRINTSSNYKRDIYHDT